MICVIVSSMFAHAVCLWLLIEPPEADYQQAISDLDSAIVAVDEQDVTTTVAGLEQALAQLEKFPRRLHTDRDTLAKLGNARLSIVALLLEHDAAAAAAVMDEAIRSAQGAELPVRRFGPDVLRLYEQRRTALAQLGTATIEVSCEVSCQVLVDERRSLNPSDPLHLGAYRVWVGATDGNLEWQYYEVILDKAGWSEMLVYPIAADEPAKLPDDIEPATNLGAATKLDTNTVQPASSPVVHSDVEPNSIPAHVARAGARKRLIPRWAEIVGAAAGAGLVITGGVLLSMNGKCSGGGEPSNPESCPKVYNNSIQAYSLLASGAGVFTLASVVLIVDEVRVDHRRGPRAMVTWVFRF